MSAAWTLDPHDRSRLVVLKLFIYQRLAIEMGCAKYAAHLHRGNEYFGDQLPLIRRRSRVTDVVFNAVVVSGGDFSRGDNLKNTSTCFG